MPRLMLAPVEKVLLRLDDAQVGLGVYLFALGMISAAVLCVFAHFSPWSKVVMGVTVGFCMLSVALHGIWRLALPWRSVAAIAGFAVFCIANATASPSGPPDYTRFAVAMVAIAVALGLYYKICLTNDWWPTDVPSEAPQGTF